VISLRALSDRLLRKNDRRTAASCRAERAIVELCGDAGKVVLGLGGGPFTVHARIINLNIAPYPNVAVVSDAHRLPFQDGSIDAVHCEAVFEHLRDPLDAAAELHRVMKPGALAYVCTPFMQGFHGYPSHFQNFTHVGHRRLFERAGFEVLECGTCVGPAWAVTDMVQGFILTYAPRLLRHVIAGAWLVFSSIFIRPLDRWLAASEKGVLLASTTYVLIRRKPDEVPTSGRRL